MSTEPISVMRLIDEVRALAAERPDYVDPRSGLRTNACSYVADEGGEACIFEQAFARLGLPADTYLTSAQLFAGEPTPDQIAWCQCVQGAQDSGSTWHHAVLRADRHIEMEAA